MQRLRFLLTIAPVAILGCSKDEPAKAKRMDPAVAAKSAVEDPCAKAKKENALAWIHDDYDAALACAKARNVPLVLDLWAPWCHTCLSMQSTVFMDPSFEPVGARFVFAALDTDREVNAAAVAKFPLSAWPTFYVVDPGGRGEPGRLESRHDEAVLARFVGAASVAQFHAFLEAGARAMAGAAAGADARLLAAERALAQKDLAAAEQELVAALAAAPPAWPRRPDALVSLIGTRHKRKDIAGCLEVAERSLDDTGNAASASDFLYHATACAEEAAKDTASTAQLARVKKLRDRAIARWQALIDDARAPLSIDDRSDAMANLRATLIAVGKPDQGKAVAEQQRMLLDEAAAAAPTPMAAMTYNWPRAEVYVFLGRPLDLVPALEKSAADLPREYDPPARLGWILLKAGRLEDAAKWTDRSIRLAYGPRKLRVLAQRADIAAKLGDAPGEKLFREEIVKTLEALPASQTTPEAIAKAKQAVANLAKPAAPDNK